MAMDIEYPAIPDEYSFFKRLSQNPKIEVLEAVQYELWRLASFSAYPEENNINTIEVAKSGLYYDSKENKIKCSCCQQSFDVKNLNENPVKVHRAKNPSCPLLRGTDTSNKPLTLDEDEDDTIEDYHSEFDLDESPSSISPTTSLPSVQRDYGLGSNGAASLPQINLTKSTRQSENRPWNSLPLARPGSDPELRTQPVRHSESDSNSRPTSPGVRESSVRTRLEDSSAEMFREEKRLETFRSWPSTAHVSPRDLARLGFFYVGEEDKTQCAFCNGILRKWDEGDDIEAEHRKYFASCPFVQGKDNRNVPMPTPPQTPVAPPPPEDPVMSQAWVARRTESTVSLTRRPLTSENHLAGAMHPNYSNFRARVTSFSPDKGWQSVNVKPQNLAEAGFFFAGFSDNVRCHFCDGGLRNWEKDDNPWVEHARWFPRCGFLKAEKGEAFIEEVKRLYPVKKVPQQTVPAEKDPLQDLPLNATFRQKARQMGFTDKQIKQAVEKNQEAKGRTFMDLQSLVDALLVLMPEYEGEAGSARAAGAGASAGTNPADPPEKPGKARSPGEQQEDEKTSNGNQGKSKKNKKKKKKGNANENSQQPPVELTSTVIIPADDEESRSLHEENRQLKEQRMCKVCMDEEVNIVFLPCGHLVSCANCAPALRACPICRALIRGSLRTYLS